MKSELWKLQATASIALLLAIAAVIGLLVVARGQPQRPAMSCEVKAGEVLVVLITADGISLTKPCAIAGGRTK